MHYLFAYILNRMYIASVNQTQRFRFPIVNDTRLGGQGQYRKTTMNTNYTTSRIQIAIGINFADAMNGYTFANDNDFAASCGKYSAILQERIEKWLEKNYTGVESAVCVDGTTGYSGNSIRFYAVDSDGDEIEATANSYETGFDETIIEEISEIIDSAKEYLYTDNPKLWYINSSEQSEDECDDVEYISIEISMDDLYFANICDWEGADETTDNLFKDALTARMKEKISGYCENATVRIDFVNLRSHSAISLHSAELCDSDKNTLSTFIRSDEHWISDVFNESCEELYSENDWY